MKMSYGGLSQVLRDSVVELRFVRRTPDTTPTRRMLCTNAVKLLNSIEAKIALKFEPPTQSLKYNAAAKNLITTWDIFWLAWRNISVESNDVISIMPVRNEEEIDKFWQYFSQHIAELSSEQRAAFGNM